MPRLHPVPQPRLDGLPQFWQIHWRAAVAAALPAAARRLRLTLAAVAAALPAGLMPLVVRDTLQSEPLLAP